MEIPSYKFNSPTKSCSVRSVETSHNCSCILSWVCGCYLREGLSVMSLFFSDCKWFLYCWYRLLVFLLFFFFRFARDFSFLLIFLFLKPNFWVLNFFPIVVKCFTFYFIDYCSYYFLPPTFFGFDCWNFGFSPLW